MAHGVAWTNLSQQHHTVNRPTWVVSLHHTPKQIPPPHHFTTKKLFFEIRNLNPKNDKIYAGLRDCHPGILGAA